MVTTKYRWLQVSENYEVKGTNNRDVAQQWSGYWLVIDLLGDVPVILYDGGVENLPIPEQAEVEPDPDSTSQIPLIVSDENQSSGEPQQEQK